MIDCHTLLPPASCRGFHNLFHCLVPSTCLFNVTDSSLKIRGWLLSLCWQPALIARLAYSQADMTNIADYNPTADAIQLRPFEVLVQVTRR
jgi:hypothetical protein